MSVHDCNTDHLKGKTKKVAELIKLHAADFYNRPPDGGGCRTFWTPKEWKDRGEQYGTEAVLIVVHDGGDMAPFFNYDYQCYSAIDALNEKLRGVGYYAEQCTSWYTAIYEL